MYVYLSEILSIKFDYKTLHNMQYTESITTEQKFEE